jgi:hypothetical protein
VLAATSPHQQILARFRELNGGVPHLSVPEVSLTEVDSVTCEQIIKIAN